MLALSATLTAFAQGPKLLGIDTAMQDMIAKQEVAGAVTAVVTKDKVLHFETHGVADVAAKRPMTPDTLFWIASMTKPITGVAILPRASAAVLHPMRQARASEAKVRESVLERLEIGEALNNDRHVRVIGHPRRASIQQELRDKRADDCEGDAELAQASLEIHHHRNERRLNS